ncbi:hypothetical protein OIDMADRAFT_139375, partial [Oidiodendron maius Zn]
MRVSRACQRCRLRKYKCDGANPCSACSSADHLCQYDPRFRKRGLVEGYVRGLERLLGLAVSNDPNFEELVISILKNRDDSSVPIKSPAHGWAIGRDKGTLLGSWKDSEVAKDVEALIPALEALDAAPWAIVRPDIDSNAATGVDGPPSEDVGPAQDPINVGDDQTPDAPQVLFPAAFESDITPQTMQNILHEPSYPRFHVPPKLPKRTGKLLQEYFCSTHCWLPIIGKHDVLRLSYQYDARSNIPRVSPYPGEFAALWALLAYQSSYEPENSHGARGGATDRREPANTLYIHARAFIPSEDMEFELGHVQALLLLALYNARFGQWSAAWLLCGQAVRVASDLGLDKLCSPTHAARLGQQNVGHVRRTFVFLRCFILETFLAARLGRAPHLRGEVLQSVDLVEEDLPEEWELW